MTFRDDERRKAWLDAQKETINRNGMRRDQSPLSTRAAADLAASRAPEQEPVVTDRVPTGSTGTVQYVGSVRDRIGTAAKKRDEKPATPQSESAGRWLAYNEYWRRRTGSYPGN